MVAEDRLQKLIESVLNGCSIALPCCNIGITKPSLLRSGHGVLFVDASFGRKITKPSFMKGPAISGRRNQPQSYWLLVITSLCSSVACLPSAPDSRSGIRNSVPEGAWL
ncbi:hypothetical protein AXX17_AT5G47290 [Arabidopsis thaliana]|uniref:Uncharacterized protein n=1 Tax=Arabidopsis thaliana TaxID=3702 RepID=A0A178UB42_ARATH|nr:hypothetical protein AXX17_AT5G47290 [Arabidopsis thaliana]